MCKTEKKRTTEVAELVEAPPEGTSYLTNPDFYVPNVKLKAPASPPDVAPVTAGADDAPDGATQTPPAAAAKLDISEHAQTPPGAALTEDVYEGETTGQKEGVHVVKCSVREAATLTDLCFREDLAEVNLISLVEEQIPRYVLRADTLTDFAGYDNSDWIQTPVIPADTKLDLTPELIEETLKYFTLCSTRVSQMTKTYNDIGAVTRLLEEKERDLELAARIGQTLLERNKELTNKNEELEQQLTEALDKNAQLKHELVMKDALLHVYVQDYDGESEPATPEEQEGFAVGALKKKVKSLEEENLLLQVEAAQLDNETTNYEEQEQSLVGTCVAQLDELNIRVDVMEEELAAKADVNLMQQDEISMLLGQTINLEGKNKKLVVDNAELNQHLAAAQEAQRQLTSELAELEEKYQECFALLQEAQDEIKALRKKQNHSVPARHHYSTFSPFQFEGSLACELEDSIRKDLNEPTGKDRKIHSKRVMDTARCVRRTTNNSDSLLSLDRLDRTSTSGNESCESVAGSDTRSSLYMSENESLLSDGYAGDTDSLHNGAPSSLGRPGIPGSNDLETALKRLSMRKANEINERMFEEDQQKKRHHRFNSEDSTTPTECHTPDSFMSTGSGSNLSEYSRFSSFRFPDKLQIVKPMEGSLTLHRWQRLATPHLGGLLEPRPGVQIKGGRKIELDEEEEEIYSLSDYEEDDDYSIYPGKCQDSTSSIFTYTNANVMHPDVDYTATSTTQFHSSSKPSVNMCASKTPAVPNTPDHGSSGTSTFSMNTGLAQSLHERPVTCRTAPGRFQCVITDSPSHNVKCTQMETLYTNSPTLIPPSQGIGASAGALKFQPENAYLNLVGRIKDIGLNNILNIAQKSQLKPVNEDPINVGLNGIMGIRRNRSRVGTRGTAQRPSLPVASTPKSGQGLASISECFVAPLGAVLTPRCDIMNSSGMSAAVRPSSLVLSSSTTQGRPISSVLPSSVLSRVAPSGELSRSTSTGTATGASSGIESRSIGSRLVALTSSTRSTPRGALTSNTVIPSKADKAAS